MIYVNKYNIEECISIQDKSFIPFCVYDSYLKDLYISVTLDGYGNTVFASLATGNRYIEKHSLYDSLKNILEYNEISIFLFESQKEYCKYILSYLMSTMIYGKYSSPYSDKYIKACDENIDFERLDYKWTYAYDRDIDNIYVLIRSSVNKYVFVNILTGNRFDDELSLSSAIKGMIHYISCDVYSSTHYYLFAQRLIEYMSDKYV